MESNLLKELKNNLKQKLKKRTLEQFNVGPTSDADPNLATAAGCADPCAINYQRPVVISYTGNTNDDATEDDLTNEDNYTVEDWNGSNGDPFIVGCNGTIYGEITGTAYWENIWAIAGLLLDSSLLIPTIPFMPVALVPAILGKLFGSGTNEVTVGFGMVGTTLLAQSTLNSVELNDFCYNPNTELTAGQIEGLDAVLNITEPTMFNDLPSGNVQLNGPQQTQALSQQYNSGTGTEDDPFISNAGSMDVSCCNYDKDYMKLLGMGPGVPDVSGIDDKPVNLDDTDPTLGISSCEDYCGNGGWELVPNIGIISEGPEIGINECSNESECLEGCFVNGAQNPQLWCTGGGGQDSQQASPSVDRMKKIAFHNKK